VDKQNLSARGRLDKALAERRYLLAGGESIFDSIEQADEAVSLARQEVAAEDLDQERSRRDELHADLIHVTIERGILRERLCDADRRFASLSREVAHLDWKLERHVEVPA
jgi:hypothetical protein